MMNKSMILGLSLALTTALVGCSNDKGDIQPEPTPEQELIAEDTNALAELETNLEVIANLDSELDVAAELEELENVTKELEDMDSVLAESENAMAELEALEELDVNFE